MRLIHQTLRDAGSRGNRERCRGREWEDSEMKRHIVCLALLVVVPASAAHASDVAFSAGFSVGVPGASVSFGVGTPAYPAQGAAAYPYAYPYQGAGAYPYEAVTIEEPPLFVQPPELGFYAAVGVPYDLFFLNNLFYLFFGNVWYSSPYYNGPWSSVYAYDVPRVLNRYPFERIRRYRDQYYGQYRRYGAWDGYRHFRPERHDGRREGYVRTRYDISRPNGSTPVYGARQSYPRPDGFGQGYADRPSYPRSYNRTRESGRRPPYVRPAGYDTVQGNGGHLFTRPGSPPHSYGNSQVSSRPDSALRVQGHSPPYSAASRAEQANSSRPAFTRPFTQGGGGNTVAFSSPNSVRQGMGSSPTFSRPNTNGYASGFGYRTDPSSGVPLSSWGRSGGSGRGGGERSGHGTGERFGHGR